MTPSRSRRFGSALLYAALFVGLVLVLLRFQGILGRPDHALVEVSTAGRPTASLTGTTATVRREVLPELVQYPARVEAIDPAKVAARVMAVVRDVLVREGDTVAAGAPLVLLDDADAEARRAQAAAAVEAAAARVTAAELAYDRAARLNAPATPGQVARQQSDEALLARLARVVR